MKIRERNLWLLVFCLFSFAACTETPRAPLVEASTENETFAFQNVSAPERDAAEPALAAAPDGGVYVVWVEHGENKSGDVMLQKFDAAGKPSGAPARVNPEAGRAAAWRGDPPTVKVAPDATVYVSWTQRIEKDGRKGTTLYLSASRDGGKSFDPPVKVNDDAGTVSHGMHSLAVDANNRVYLAWLDERNVKKEEPAATPAPAAPQPAASHDPSKHKMDEEPNSEVFYAVSRDGGRTFSANRKISSEVCPCCKTSLAVAPGDKVFVSWRQVVGGEFRHIAVAALENGGESFTAPVIVSDDQWQINACPVSGASLAVGPDGALEVRWFSAGRAGEPGLYRAVSTDGGRTFGPRALVNAAIVSGSSQLVARKAGETTSVFESEGKLFRADSSGKTEELGPGALPAAVAAGEKVFVAYIKKEGEKRRVRLALF